MTLDMTDPMFHDLSGAHSITPLGQIMWKDPALRTEADIRQIYNLVRRRSAACGREL